MLLLTSTSDKIRVTTDSAANLDVHVSYLKYVGSAVTPGRLNTAIASATTTDIIGPPGSSEQWSVKTIHFRNKHASTTVNIIILHTDGSTPVQIQELPLLAGEEASYIEGQGWRLFDASGLLK